MGELWRRFAAFSLTPSDGADGVRAAYLIALKNPPLRRVSVFPRWLAGMPLLERRLTPDALEHVKEWLFEVRPIFGPIGGVFQRNPYLWLRNLRKLLFGVGLFVVIPFSVWLGSWRLLSFVFS